jgi:hypothetical protein
LNIKTDNYFWDRVFPLLFTAIVALGGYWLLHHFSAKRDRVNKQRDLRIEYLISTYSRLANANLRKPEPGSQYFRDMETAMDDIQLFGTDSQIKKANEMMDEFQETRSARLNELLRDLRDDLRQEMDLPEIKRDVQWFRPEGVLIPESNR